MVDRQARAKTAEAIRAFLTGELTSHQFDDALEAACVANDPLLCQMRDAAWYSYDDIEDHRVALPRERWDQLCRYLLILESEADLQVFERRRWEWGARHAIATVALVVCVAGAFQVGWNWHLFLWMAPFGVLSFLLTAWWHSQQPVLTTEESALVPFTSVQDLAQTRRLAPRFERPRFPQEVGRRQIRGDVHMGILYVQSFFARVSTAPFWLLAQAVPNRHATWRVSVSRGAARTTGSWTSEAG